MIEGDKNILTHATYKELLGLSDRPTFKLDPSCWEQEEKITQENEILSRPFSIEEIKKVVFFYGELVTNTALVPDHIPIEFYQTSWEVIKGNGFVFGVS